MSTALKVTGRPGSETQCSDTLQVKMGTTGLVSKEKVGPFPTHTWENLQCSLQAALLRSLSNDFLSWIVSEFETKWK